MVKIFSRKKGEGVSLVELLFVVAIIGILATIALAGVSSARAKARDKKRLVELNQIRSAIEFYRSENEHYPDSSSGIDDVSDSEGHKIGRGDNMDVILSPYMSVPRDPKDEGGNYYYFYDPCFICFYNSESHAFREVTALGAKNMETIFNKEDMKNCYRDDAGKYTLIIEERCQL